MDIKYNITIMINIKDINIGLKIGKKLHQLIL